MVTRKDVTLLRNRFSGKSIWSVLRTQVETTLGQYMVEHTFSGAVFFLSKILVVMIVKYDFIKFNSFNELGVKSIAEPAFKI